MKISLVPVFALILFSASFSPENQLTVTAVNKLKIPRQNETIELTASDLASLGEKDLMKIHFNGERGWLAIWEPVEKNLGTQGLAIVVNPADVDKLGEDKLNHLVILKPTTTPVSYWAGFAWDRAGKITSAESWKNYVNQFAERLRSPIEVAVK